MTRSLTTAALLALLVGCGSEQPEGPLADGPDPPASASPSSDLPPFEMPAKGDPMARTEPPEMEQGRQGAIEFATYRESLTADGLAPPVAQLLRDTASSSCAGCAEQLRFVLDFNTKGLTLEPRGPSRFHGVVDAFEDKEGWQVVLEYSLHAASGVDPAGKRVQTFKPARFVQAVDTLSWEDDHWVATRIKNTFLDSTQIGGQ